MQIVFNVGMKRISIAATDQTPFVILDKENSKMEIRGYSFSDDTLGFYSEIVRWFKEYSKEPNQETRVILDFKYVNSTSVKFINDLLKNLDAISANGKSVTVDWLHEADDEDVQQLGNTLKEFHTIAFNIIPKIISKEGGKKKMF